MSIRQGQTIVAGGTSVKSVQIIGEVKKISGTSSYVPTGCLPCDGNIYRADQFQDLWNNYLISSPAKLNVCTFAEYANQINTYSFCNSFAIDTDQNLFKTPTRNSYRKLVKKYINGNDWYNLYDDGWCEQGGYTGTDGAITVTYKVPYSNNNYTITLGLISTYTGSGQALDNTGIRTKSATDFTLYSDVNTSKWWKASGYTAIPDTTANIDREFIVVVNGFANTSTFDWSNWQQGLANKADKDLVNTNRITNCITYIPQDINLELNSGTLTLKAGSKVYIPNGNDVFDTVTISSDIAFTLQTDRQGMIWYDNIQTRLREFPASICFSSSSAPTGFGQYALWYDTTNNKIKYTIDSGSTWTENQSLPLGLITSSTTQITSIDQVFNGFGYIGSTNFVLPGVKGLSPNGLNSDGSLNNQEFICNAVQVATTNDGSKPRCIFGNAAFAMNRSYDYNYFIQDDEPTASVALTWWYSPSKNTLKKWTGTEWKSGWIFIKKDIQSSGQITHASQPNNFKLLTDNSKELIASFGMLSNTYIDLTLGTSDTTYTAPANGYYYLSKVTSATNQYIQFGIGSATSASAVAAKVIYSPTSGGTCAGIFQCYKGQTIYISYTAGGTTKAFRFVYAVGSEP